MKEKKEINPVWFLVIGIVVLIVPTAVYLGFLMPQMKEEYDILLASGGVIGVGGMYGAEMIPEKVKFGTLYKTSARSFTLLTVITLVQDFIPQLIGLAIVLVVSYIIFMMMRSLYKDGKQARADKRLAKEVARGITEAVK